MFLQGWPDNRGVWAPLECEKSLAAQRRLFINFPNTSTTQSEVRTGLDFPDVIRQLKATLDQVGAEQFKKKVIVGHDWGAVYAYHFDKVVTM